MGQNKLTIRKRTIGLIVLGVLIVLIVGIFAAVAALQWWVATISALAVPVVIAVGMVAAVVGYQNFNTQIRDLRTQLRLAHEEIGKLEETIRRLQAVSKNTTDPSGWWSRNEEDGIHLLNETERPTVAGMSDSPLVGMIRDALHESQRRGESQAGATAAQARRRQWWLDWGTPWYGRSGPLRIHLMWC